MNQRTITKKVVQNDIADLEKLAHPEQDHERLERLKKAALSGVSLKTWFRRFLFGFSLTDAIEKWLAAFNPSWDKLLSE